MTKNEDILLRGRPRDLGGFQVHRVLPQIELRHVGPFVFLDHMGPLTIDETHALDVRPHPHIGLATVTYLFEGRGLHRDSLGSKQVIRPGDLNWMTAGRGIAHSERTPPEDRDPAAHNRTHGVQIWVGLPVAHEEDEPSFAHWPKESMPMVDAGPNLTAKLMIGEFAGARSPVKTLSRLLFMELKVTEDFDGDLSFGESELGLYVIGAGPASGGVRINGQDRGPEDFVKVADPGRVSLRAPAGTHLIVIGGEPFPEPRHMWWNFVSSRKERIHQAADDWKNGRFGRVDGETDFIPLPDTRLP